MVFRVDASIDMGSGHVMRSLTLADELRKHGAAITFITRAHPGNMADAIKKKGYELCLLPAPSFDYKQRKDDVSHASWLGVTWEQDIEETRFAMGDSKPEWLIVDHYGLDARWHRELRKQVGQILAIDDLADRPLDCDMLLDQTYGRQEDDYLQWVPSNCQMLLGSRYALLRPEFSVLRSAAIEKRKVFNGINRILVSMGGTDPENVTATVLKGLSGIDWQQNPVIDVVMGGNAPHLDEVIELPKKSTLKIMVSTDVADMAERMLAADLAIGAGGTTSWERCCLGLPTLMISLAENQTLIAYKVEKAGASIYIGSMDVFTAKSVKSSLKMLNENSGLMRDMASTGFQLADGAGVKRLADRMVQGL